MKFTRLRLVGFKSFCDPTELHLEPGLSGVVGPNGCGKSNLVEAMRWVMGESSYKAMRAGGMDDVIFSGSGNRPARNSAEVTLVLDNSDRSAPAPLNTADVLEVTRRIEREAGSVYRVNGREVRARDVQLLFADASTGAHSPALVRQGQIGELIAARPQQRRALLEEAAGISGLHSRRHEAELRLRAAEQNLERVDDIIAQIEQQLETLRRQARLAVRYRGLSGEIRKAEAALYHLRWVMARAAEKEAEAEQGRLMLRLADAQHVELEAQKVLFLAEKAVQPLREAEAGAAAASQRLKLLGEQLVEEERRIAARRSELSGRLGQLDADAGREAALVAESAETLMRYAAETAALDAATEAARAAHAGAAAGAATAAAEAATAEAASRSAHEALAALRARRAQAGQLVREAAGRVERGGRQLAEAERDLAALSQASPADAAVAARREALASAQGEAGRAEAAALAAEEAGRAAQAALDAARPALQGLESGLKGLEAEAATLTRILQRAAGSALPGIADALTVLSGYETALGAALGDDLDAPAAERAPIRWTEPGPADADPPLPQGAAPLSRFVSGSPLLRRRLDQIGLVEEEDGPRLLAALRPGQMLVTRKGALWRWDGLVAAADAPSAAAERLAQRNRLAEIAAETGARRAELNARRADAEALARRLEQARATERERRDGWRAAQRRIAEAQAGLDAASRALGQIVSRRAALEEARARLAANHAEAVQMQRAAEAALAGAEDEAGAAARAAEADAALATLRQRAEQARLALGEVAAAARQREQRRAQIASEAAAWTRRRDGAEAQRAILFERRGAVARELESLAADPETQADKRRALEAELALAAEAHKAAGDRLAAAETRHREADRAQRLAAEALSGTREQLGRVEERLKAAIARRQQIEQLTEETLGAPARRTAELAGLRAQDPLPDERQTEQRIERLKAERERLGGVNLTAEQESEEVRLRLETMTADRDDLIGAIAKLRGAIQGLNREGRARLAEAFDKVNAHFQELFTALFGGGTAELRFVESEDPLEAGLEIFARPPGKKPATMTLLSGGEQALTAMSLIFAVFLTNPAPICVLDEVDAPLDDANVERFCNLLDQMRRRTDTRFLVITHNPITMSRVDRLFGVTMAERGVSQLVSVDLRQAESFREAG